MRSDVNEWRRILGSLVVAWVVARGKGGIALGTGLGFERKTFGVFDGFDSQIDVQVRPIVMSR